MNCYSAAGEAFTSAQNLAHRAREEWPVSLKERERIESAIPTMAGAVVCAVLAVQYCDGGKLPPAYASLRRNAIGAAKEYAAAHAAMEAAASQDEQEFFSALSAGIQATT